MNRNTQINEAPSLWGRGLLRPVRHPAQFNLTRKGIGALDPTYGPAPKGLQPLRK
jgi:hypothetical protein